MELHRHVLDSDMVFVRHMLALQLGNCIGHGLPFPGMDTVQSRVLCFGFEGTTLGLAQRLEQQHEGLSIAEPGKHIALKEPVRAVRAHRRPLRRAHASDEVKDVSVLHSGPISTRSQRGSSASVDTAAMSAVRPPFAGRNGRTGWAPSSSFRPRRCATSRASA